MYVCFCLACYYQSSLSACYYYFICFSLLGDDCVSLDAPPNASIWCNGPQITDQYCIVTCHPGFTLIGSSNRTCLPDHTWSDNEATCAPLNCSDLKAPSNALVTAPCSTSYTSECVVICEYGYHISTDTPNNDYYWTQTCSIDDDVVNGSTHGVTWTESMECAYSKYIR